MANSTIPNLVAVSVPALTDLFGVRQSGDARDKKLTVTQLLTLVPAGGDVSKVGTPADNQLGVWTGDGTIEGASQLTLGGGVLVLNPGTETRMTGDLKLQTGSGQAPLIRDTSANVTVPTLCPAVADTNTGIGWLGGDRMSLVSGGVAGLILAETNGAVIPAYDSEIAVTAFAGGGQGSAVAMNHGYNTVSVVATTGDSVRLPTGLSFLKGSVVYIKNDGANSLDLFPGSGDDLGAGVDTAISVPAGASVAFIGTTADSVWTQLIFEAGGGDVTKVGTPVNNQVGVWTGDGTIEGDTDFTWDGAHLLLPLLNDAATPTFAFGDGDTGFYESSDDVLRVSCGGAHRFSFNSLLGGNFISQQGNGPQMRNVASSSVIPTLNPRQGDPNTGIGTGADDQLSLIAGAVMGIQIIEGGAAITAVNIFGPTVVAADIRVTDANGPLLFNDAATTTVPTLIPNRADADTGIGGTAGVVNMIANSVEGIRVTEGEGSIATGFAGRFEGLNVTGSAAIRDIAASATVPTLHPNKTNLTMGIGAAGSSQMNFIVDAVTCMSVAEDTSAPQIGFYATTPISLQTGVAVTAGGIHAALVALGLITA